jgi:hypothetical protein
MCRSNVIIYQNETKLEIYCNDKTESHHSIKSIFDFRTSLPINEILYIQYINGKQKKSHRIKSHKTSSKKVTGKKVTIYFSTFTIPRKVTVCIMSDFVHTQVMVFIASQQSK